MPKRSTTGGPDGRWISLGAIAIAQLMVVLDATIINVALPSAQTELGFADDGRQWIVTAYSLAFGSLLLLGGRLSDTIGRRTAFVVGSAGFALASVLGGFAQSFEILVVARALQGVFGALLAPAALSLLSVTFSEPKERGRAFGIFGAIASSGGAIGVLLGGALTEAASWRLCMFVNVVFAGAAVVLALMSVPADRTVARRERLDVPGLVLATVGLVAIVYGFSSAEQFGWGSPLTIATLVGGVVVLAIFVVVERRVSAPMLPLRVVLDRDRGGAYLAIALSMAATFGAFLFLTYYMQELLGFSALATGLGFLPLSLAIIIGSTQVAARLLPVMGPRVLTVGGGALAAVGMALMLRLGPDTGYVATLLPALLVMGIGIGTLIAAAISTGTAGVDPADAGVASAMVNTSQQIGGSIGAAYLSSLFADAIVRASGDQIAGYHAVFVAGAVALLLAAAAGLLLRARSRR